MLTQDTVYLQLYKYILPIYNNIEMPISTLPILLCAAAFKPIESDRTFLLQTISRLMKVFLKCMENSAEGLLARRNLVTSFNIGCPH